MSQCRVLCIVYAPVSSVQYAPRPFCGGWSGSLPWGAATGVSGAMSLLLQVYLNHCGQFLPNLIYKIISNVAIRQLLHSFIHARARTHTNAYSHAGMQAHVNIIYTKVYKVVRSQGSIYRPVRCLWALGGAANYCQAWQSQLVYNRLLYKQL